MIGFAQPLLLWLAASAALPVLLHLWNRRKPKEIAFASLVLLRKEQKITLQRRKLRDLLQLILRTLALLCLAFAAAGPKWNSSPIHDAPESALMLNYQGSLANQSWDKSTFNGWQLGLQGSLDSLLPGRVSYRSWPERIRSGTTARLGDPRPAFQMSLRQDLHPNQKVVWHIPIPFGEALQNLEPLLENALTTFPNLQIRLWNAGDLPEITPFRGLVFDDSIPGQIRSIIDLTENANIDFLHWKPRLGSSVQIKVKENRAFHTLRLLPKIRVLGAFMALPNEKKSYPFLEMPVSLSIHQPDTILFAGSDLAFKSSLTELTESNGAGFLSMLSAINPIPGKGIWALCPNRAEWNGLWGLAEKHVRSGGVLIMVLPKNFDAVAVNRDFLLPLGLGRIEAKVTGSPLPVHTTTRMDSLSGKTKTWGNPGFVSQYARMIPNPSFKSLLLVGHDPILGLAEVGKGKALIWLTDLDQVDASDLGLGPWPTLIHKSFLGNAARKNYENLSLEADSLWFLPEEFIQTRVESKTSELTLRLPDGSQKTLSANATSVGPFDQVGFHQIFHGADTVTLAIRPTVSHLMTKASIEKEFSNWKTASRQDPQRIDLLSIDENLLSFGQDRPLGFSLLLFALLLLLVEAGLPLFLGSGRQNP